MCAQTRRSWPWWCASATHPFLVRKNFFFLLKRLNMLSTTQRTVTSIHSCSKAEDWPWQWLVTTTDRDISYLRIQINAPVGADGSGGDGASRYRRQLIWHVVKYVSLLMLATRHLNCLPVAVHCIKRRLCFAKEINNDGTEIGCSSLLQVCNFNELVIANFNRWIVTHADGCP